MIDPALGETSREDDPRCHNCGKLVRRVWHSAEIADPSEPGNAWKRTPIVPRLGGLVLSTYGSDPIVIRAIRKARRKHGAVTHEVWGGGFSYYGQMPYAFCTLRCTAEFGNAAAHAGFEIR